MTGALIQVVREIAVELELSETEVHWTGYEAARDAGDDAWDALKRGGRRAQMWRTLKAVKMRDEGITAEDLRVT